MVKYSDYYSSFLPSIEDKKPISKGFLSVSETETGGTPVLEIITLMFLFLILVYNSGVSSHAQVNLVVTNGSTTDQTLLAISSNLGWIAVVSVLLISVFLYASRKDEVRNMQGYLVYITAALLIVIVLQAILMLYVRGSVNGQTVQLSSTIERNLLIAGILSLTVAAIIILFLLIVGFRRVRD